MPHARAHAHTRTEREKKRESVWSIKFLCNKNVFLPNVSSFRANWLNWLCIHKTPNVVYWMVLAFLVPWLPSPNIPDLSQLPFTHPSPKGRAADKCDDMWIWPLTLRHTPEGSYSLAWSPNSGQYLKTMFNRKGRRDLHPIPNQREGVSETISPQTTTKPH